jgi:hypothetical protein
MKDLDRRLKRLEEARPRDEADAYDGSLEAVLASLERLLDDPAEWARHQERLGSLPAGFFVTPKGQELPELEEGKP